MLTLNLAETCPECGCKPVGIKHKLELQPIITAERPWRVECLECAAGPLTGMVDLEAAIRLWQVWTRKALRERGLPC